MSSFDYLRRRALSLPDVEEGDHRGGPAFRVRGKTFALWWAEGERTILRLRPGHQELLFEARPDVFEACRVGVGVWSYVRLDRLDDDEVDGLVLEAWEGVAPKSARISRTVT